MFQTKYLKYKSKYMFLKHKLNKKIHGGSHDANPTICDGLIKSDGTTFNIHSTSEKDQLSELTNAGKQKDWKSKGGLWGTVYRRDNHRSQQIYVYTNIYGKEIGVHSVGKTFELNAECYPVFDFCKNGPADELNNLLPPLTNIVDLELQCIVDDKKLVGYFNYSLYPINYAKFPNPTLNSDDSDDSDESDESDSKLEFDIQMQTKAINDTLHVLNLYETNELKNESKPRCTLVFKKDNWKYARIIIKVFMDLHLDYTEKEILHGIRNFIFGICIGYKKDNIIGFCKKLTNSDDCENQYDKALNYVNQFISNNGSALFADNDPITKEMNDNNSCNIIINK